MPPPPHLHWQFKQAWLVGGREAASSSSSSSSTTTTTRNTSSNGRMITGICFLYGLVRLAPRMGPSFPASTVQIGFVEPNNNLRKSPDTGHLSQAPKQFRPLDEANTGSAT